MFNNDYISVLFAPRFLFFLQHYLHITYGPFLLYPLKTTTTTERVRETETETERDTLTDNLGLKFLEILPPWNLFKRISHYRFPPELMIWFWLYELLLCYSFSINGNLICISKAHSAILHEAFPNVLN